jgi:hypothetical protein
MALVEKAKIKAGEFVLVDGKHEMSEAVINVAKAKGARVIVGARNGNFPSDVSCVDQMGLNFKEYVMRITDGKGVNVAVHMESSMTNDSVLAVLAVRARFCFLGVRSASSITASNISQMVVSYAPYLNTARGKARLQTTVKTVVALLEASKLPSLLISNVTEVNGLMQTTFNGRASYLVVEGFSQLGQEVARWLAQRGARNIVLTTSSQHKNSFDQATLKCLASVGCEVRVIEANASEQAGVTKILSQPKNAPQLKGIFNATEGKTAGYPEHLDALATSSLFLHEATHDMHLDHFVVLTRTLLLAEQGPWAARPFLLLWRPRLSSIVS